MKLHKPDTFLLVLIGLLLTGGLIVLASASVSVSFHRYGSTSYLIVNQLTSGVLVGLGAFLVAFFIPYHLWRRLALPGLLLALVLLGLVLTPQLGFGAGGARRWLSIGPLFFQPAEGAKLAIIVYLAAFFAKQKKDGSVRFLTGVLPFLAVMGAMLVLIAKQPDIGTLGVIALISFAMFFVAGAEWKHVLLLGLSGIALLFAFIYSADYRMNRFLVFLDPSHDPQGKGYQVQQALLATGSGGLWGLGLGESRQKYNFLPESVGDSIFAIVGEELGFVGATALILLFVLFALRALWIANRAPDPFGKYLATGIAAWVALQAFVNIMANIGLIPLTGVTLPFVSYGGSSLALILAGCGILANISRHTKV